LGSKSFCQFHLVQHGQALSFSTKSAARTITHHHPRKAVAVPLAQIENCVKRQELSEAETALRQNISQKGSGTQSN
jgi:hypothetical protein